MSENLILTEVKDRVRTLTMNRAEKKNALTVAMYEDLVASMKEGEDDKETRVHFITGAGDAFTSGNDVMDFMNTPPAGMDSPVGQFLRVLVEAKKPIVACVNGPAVGIGTTMLLHSDLVFAKRSATFKMPFVPLGVVPEAASSLLLPRMVGLPKASELLLLGEKFSAEVAHDAGLVGTIVDDDVMSVAMEKAKKLAQLPPESVRHTKRLLRAGMRERVVEVIQEEGELFLEKVRSPEAIEAFTAFIEKRAPDFSQFD